jgi:CheY-like chemotaxis protein
MARLGVLDPYADPSRFDVLVSDIRMPGYSGLEVLASARELDDCPPVLLISAFADGEARQRAKELGALDLLAKPFDMEDLVERLAEIAPPGRRTAETSPDAAATAETDTVVPAFPVDVTFRRGHRSEPIKDFVNRLAGRLERYGPEVQHAHVVIDRRDAEQGAIEVSLVVTTPREAVVAHHEAHRGEDDVSVYVALRVAFGIAARRLKQIRSKSRRNRHGHDTPRTASPVGEDSPWLPDES